MAYISLYESEKIRETLTRGQQKQIQDIYRNIAEKMAKEAEKLKGKDNTSSILRRQWLNDMQKKLNAEMENIHGDITKTIKNTMAKTAQAVANDSIKFFERNNIPMKGAFQNVPADIVERVATGKLYGGNWTLSKAIWTDIKYTQKDINTIISESVAEGIAGNKSVYEIAKDLEAYIDPAAKKTWDWNKVYPGTKKQIDYNAQRLARTMVSHAYQQSLIQTVKHNPFVEYIRWRSSDSSLRVCKKCNIMNGVLFPKDDLPLDHPNGMCTFIPEIGSMDDVAKRLADWANGKEDARLDKFYENAYQGNTKKISSKVLKKSDKNDIIEIQNKNENGLSDLRVNTGGLRNEKELTEEQVLDAINYATFLDMPKEKIRYGDHYNVSYGEQFDMLYLGTDLYPADNPMQDTKNANSRISWKSSIAHEIIGHREAKLKGLTQSIDVLEEAQASIRAARFAPGLSGTERITLLRDAVTRLHKENYAARDVKNILNIEER